MSRLSLQWAQCCGRRKDKAQGALSTAFRVGGGGEWKMIDPQVPAPRLGMVELMGTRR